jgi:hypothetical protein
VLIELDGECVDLALELAEAAREPIALLAERFGERHHGLDEPVLAVVGGARVVQSVVLRHEVAKGPANRMPEPLSARMRTSRAGRVVRLTA